MGRVVRIITTATPGGFPHTPVKHAPVLIQKRKIGAAHGAVFVQKEARAVETPVFVELKGFLQVANALVNTIVLLLDQCGIKPGCRIIAFKFFGKVQFMRCALDVAVIAIGFAEIAAQKGSLWFQGGSDEQVFTPTIPAATADATKTSTQPGVAEGGVHIDGMIEPLD